MSRKIFNNEEQDALNFLQDKKNIIISIQHHSCIVNHISCLEVSNENIIQG